MSDITRRAAIDKGVPAIITRDSGDADVTTPTEGTNNPTLPAALVDPNAAESMQQSPAPPPVPVSDDVDDIELRDARAAAKAEEATVTGTTQPAPVEGTSSPQPSASAEAAASQEPAPPASQEAPAEPQPPAQQQPTAPAARLPMVPKARFDEVNARASSAEERASKAEQESAYWRGRAEAAQHAAPVAAGQQPTAPVPAPQTPEQRLAAVRESKIALAKKFDDGEMSMVDYERQRDELDDQMQAIREENLITKVKPAEPPPQNGGSDALYLETLTSQLEEKHPWVTIFDKVGGERDWQFLEGEARANLTERGIPLNQGALSSYHLREEMARLADEYGPGMLTKRAQAKGIDLPKSPAAMQPPQAPPQSPAPAAPAPGQRTLSTVAAARAGKLEQAALAPPRMDTISGVPADSGLTESQLNSMSDDDIGALPDAVRRKALGIT